MFDVDKTLFLRLMRIEFTRLWDHHANNCAFITNKFSAMILTLNNRLFVVLISSFTRSNEQFIKLFTYLALIKRKNNFIYINK